MEAIRARGAAFAQAITLFGFTWAGTATPIMMEYAYLDSSGAVISKSRGLALLTPDQGSIPPDEKRELARGFESIFLALYFSLCLFHTKNVTVMDEPATHARRGRHKRGGVDHTHGTRFKILDITPLKQEARRVSGADSPGDEIKRAMHLCRGHYRRYTEDGKLFGKHTGIFWIASHNRGSREIGEIKKDYRLNAPAAS